MKPLLALVVLLLVTACSGAGEDTVATDPAPTGSGSGSGSAMPTRVPAAPGPVSTRGLVTVIDSGAGPHVCLGPVAESYPPQCTGPDLVGWDWEGTGQGAFEEQSGVRWGTYAISGTWDGTRLSATSAIAAALYDAAAAVPTDPPTPLATYAADELAAIAVALGEGLPGALSAYPDDQGHLLVDVTYDDGSLQEWADGEYGAGVVVVTSVLVGQ